MQPIKHFAFLLHYPKKDKCLLWPGFYEDCKEEIDKDFKEVEYDIHQLVEWHAFLERQGYKVFIKKTREDKHK